MPRYDITTRPKRALTAEERQELFREFKLGLFALAALVALVVTLCWDRGGERGREGAIAQNTAPDGAGVVRVVWQPGGQGGSSPVQTTRIDRDADAPADPRRPEADDDRHLPPRPERSDRERRETDRAPDEDAAPPGPSYRNYVVKRGDRLWRIAERQLGHGRYWKLIKQANPALRDPNKLRPGMVLRIPLRALPGGQLADGPATGGRLVLDSSSSAQ